MGGGGVNGQKIFPCKGSATAHSHQIQSNLQNLDQVLVAFKINKNKFQTSLFVIGFDMEIVKSMLNLNENSSVELVQEFF